MNCRLALFVTLALAAPALSQPDANIFTNPKVPAPRDLDRLNLDMAWKNYIPIENRADGIATFQIFDGQIFAQTRAGLVVVLNESNGEEIWRFNPPKRYPLVQPIAVNRDLVLLSNGPRLFILQRTNGKVKYMVDLPTTPSAGLAADMQQCFIPLSNEKVISVGLTPEDIRAGQRARPLIDQPEPPTGISLEKDEAYPLSTPGNKTPSIALLQTTRPPYKHKSKDITASLAVSETLRNPYKLEMGGRSPSLQMVTNLRNIGELSDVNMPDQPRVLWELFLDRRIEETPLLYDGMADQFLILAATKGVFVCDKYANRQNKIRHEYLADRSLSAPIAKYGAELYLCVSDGNSYWVHIEDFRNEGVPVPLVKRFMAGAQIDHKPLTTDDSVYLASSQAGVYRLDRKTFERIWSNPEVEQVYAVNPKVVYAGDRRGNLVILDKARGLKLATFDIRAFNYSVLNEQDDRLLLAGNNGLIVCLHDRSYRRSEPIRKLEPKPVLDPRDAPKKDIPMMPPPPPPKMDEPKKEEPKKEEAKKEEAKKEEPK